MTQADLVRKMAQGADITQPHAAQALCILLQSIQIALCRGERVKLVGFGTFGVRSRVARRGRNPRTGQEVSIRARKIPTFAAGKWLREAIRS